MDKRDPSPVHLKTQAMCEEAVWIEPRSLAFVPSHFKTESLFIKAVRKDPYALDCVPDDLKTKKYVTRQYVKNQQLFFLYPILLKHKNCVK